MKVDGTVYKPHKSVVPKLEQGDHCTICGGLAVRMCAIDTWQYETRCKAHANRDTE